MPDLIFFTPMLPFPTGHGSSMRASVAVEILSEKHRVFVVHSPIWPWRGVFSEAWVRDRATGYATVPVQPDSSTLEQLVRTEFRGAHFTAVYAFRLAMAPLALRFLGIAGNPRPSMVLDLDDDDVSRSERFVALRERTGDRGRAAREQVELPRLRIHQKMLVPRFDVNLLAGPNDCRSLAAQFPEQKFLCLPNVVRPVTAPDEPNPLSLLFIGSMDYLPNADGVEYFCQSVLPLLRGMVPPFKLRVAGHGAEPQVLALGRHPEVQMVGMVPDVTPEYAKAGVVVVPLRAGSGTRIKILEAFSYRRPVVSTTIGAEGLHVTHDQHLLIADTPEEFASACARLMTDRGLRERLVDNAFAFLEAEHSIARARSVLHSLYAP